MTNSATSTERRAADGRGFHAWHFFTLLAMAGATAAVMVSRETHPVALLLLSAAVICSGLVAVALSQAIAGFFRRAPEAAPLAPQARESLEREKMFVLRSIKELEFDRGMGKISDADFAGISGRLRARAIVLMQDLDRTTLAPEPAAPLTTAASGCAKCGTKNDPDARFCKNCGIALLMLLLALVCPVPTANAQTMPNPKEMSGSVLPVSDMPVGTVSVRVIRGSFDKNIEGQTVQFFIDGKTREAKTDAGGRAQIAGLARGARLRAVAVVDGERLESKEAVIENAGLRIILVATDPEAAKREAEDRALASAPPVKGIVVFGPESRVIARVSFDRLDIYYILQIVNSARTPVDIGGPLRIDLPREARGTTILEGSTPKATAGGAHITVTGPFPPGNTAVQAAYELPHSGVARIDQLWPAALQQVMILVEQIGGLSISSPQIAKKQELMEQGQRVIVATGPGLAAGKSLNLEIAGLPHPPVWPRNLALSLAGLIVAAGIWGAVTATPSRRAA